jgi:hypothetical protein
MVAAEVVEPLRRPHRNVDAYADQSHQTFGSGSSREALRKACRGNVPTTPPERSSISRSLICASTRGLKAQSMGRCRAWFKMNT